ncbi:hypothetical protein, partial [Paraburkholderia sp. SIMBA_054]|uniref:hypothetical protein n=1 Tax=Paraburkholderia sp. SIMBA_054 TaxID=3085795 RepID=UPI00397A5E5D
LKASAPANDKVNTPFFNDFIDPSLLFIMLPSHLFRSCSPFSCQNDKNDSFVTRNNKLQLPSALLEIIEKINYSAKTLLSS